MSSLLVCHSFLMWNMGHRKAETIFIQGHHFFPLNYFKNVSIVLCLYNIHHFEKNILPVFILKIYFVDTAYLMSQSSMCMVAFFSQDSTCFFIYWRTVSAYICHQHSQWKSDWIIPAVPDTQVSQQPSEDKYCIYIYCCRVYMCVCVFCVCAVL